MDITTTQDLGASRINTRANVDFPAKVAFQDEVNPLLSNLTKSNMRENLETFSSFHTRYYKSDYGKQSSEWLLEQVQNIIKEAGAEHVYAKHFPHSWQQVSLWDSPLPFVSVLGRETVSEPHSGEFEVHVSEDMPIMIPFRESLLGYH